MYSKLTCLIALVLVLAAGTNVQAEVFTDDFETPYDYVAVAAEDPGRISQETIWDDFIGWYTGEDVNALNASIDRPGQLYISSENGTWDSPWTPLSPFLFKIVEGDFIATVRVTDYAGTEEDPVFHNDGGLMVRATTEPNVAGPGEDWVSIDYFPIWNIGNMVWEARDGTRDEAWSCHNNTQWDLDPYLRIERSGNYIHLYTSPDGENWTEMACSPKLREDFDGLPLMVGLRHSTYLTDPGYVAFDDFRLETIVRYKAYAPLPADEAKNVDPDSDLTWTAGAKVEFHDVYFGKDFDSVSNADTSTTEIYKGRQSETTYELDTLGYGATYYWRIDEVNDSDPNFWPGDVWSFKVLKLEASEPSPPDGAQCVPVDIGTLTWTPGAQANMHWVYFGTTSPLPLTPFKMRTTADCPLSLFGYDQLDYDTTYYWRVDEKKLPTTWTGEEWSFRTAPQIPIVEPGLVGWWKLNDVGCGTTVGTTVIDSSGHDHHGTLEGDFQYVAGYDGEALQFDGKNDYVELPIGSLIGSLTNSTFMVWLDSEPGGSWVRAFDFGAEDPNFFMCLGPRWWFMDDMYFSITTTGDENEVLVQPTGFDIETGWQHVAVTIDADNSTIILYYNGEELARNANATLSPQDLGETTNNWLGRSHDEDNSYYKGSMDDFRIYDYVLSRAEIEKAMLGDPRLAWKPKPDNGSTTDIEHYAPFSWTPGEAAAQHDVYFGTDPNAVRDANESDASGIYRGRQDPNTYTPPEELQWGQIYYWRIDEYNTDDTISTGRVWSFTIADYLVVDDMESYGDANTPGPPTPPGSRIWYTWRDGSGWKNPAPANPGNGSCATVDLETSNVRNGNQSLMLIYDNDGGFFNALSQPVNAYYSKIERTFDPPQDWTRKGVKSLTIWFYGDSENSSEPSLYAVIEDSLGATGVATYSDPSEIWEARWHEWNIDPVALGVDPTQIAKLSIGIGDESGTEPTGTGTVYLDDISLYRPRCIPSLLQPAADLNDDCVVDFDDIITLAGRWLDSGLIVTPSAPGTANLVGHWKLDEAPGSYVANDSSVNANHGTLYGDAGTAWVDGYDGGAMRFFDVEEYRLELPISSLINTLTKSSFMAWVKVSNLNIAWQRIFDFGNYLGGDDPDVYMYLTPSMGAGAAMRFAITTTGAASEDRLDSSITLTSGWHHVAVTISDPNGAGTRTLRLYIDGAQVGVNTAATLSPSDLGSTDTNWLGRSEFGADPYYVGLIDDFRIYSRDLSASEVAWLAGRTSPFSIEMDFDQNGKIDFADFAELGDLWQQELLWP